MSEDFAYRAKVLITQRRYQDAVRLCRRGLLTDPSREEGRLVLGMALLAMRRFEEVRAEMLALLRARPEDSVARRLLGQAFLEAGDLVRASEELEAVRRLAPSDPRIAELLDEVSEAQKDEPVASPSPSPRRWAEAEELETTPGDIPAPADRQLAPAAARPPAPAHAATAPSHETVTQPLEDQTFPDPLPAHLRELRVDVGALPSVVTQVLALDDAERMRKASVLMTTSPGEAALSDPTVPGSAASAGVPEPGRIAPTPSAADLIEVDASTDIAGPPPLRPQASPAEPTVPGAVSFVAAKGWPADPPPTITPVMPALVRAAARLAAATRGKSSLRVAIAEPDVPPAPAPVVFASPSSTLALAAAPVAVLTVVPSPSPAATSLPLLTPLPQQSFDPLEIDTKSYAAASEEARAREAGRSAEPRGRKPSLEEVRAVQQKFADAVSEISEVSEVDQSALPRPIVEVRSPAATPRVPEPRGGQPVEGAPSGDDEPESTVTEVPQSYREGGSPRGGAPRPGGPSAPAPATLEGGRTSSPMTVVAKPVGNMATQHASPDGVAPTALARAVPAPPSRPQVPEALRSRPASETAPAPPLADDRVTRALDPEERPDREGSLPPARLSQPPSFLDPQIDPPRRPGPKSAGDPQRPLGPPRSAIAPPAPASLPGLSSLPPPMPAPGRVTMPVIDEEDAKGKRISRPTIDGTPKNVLTSELRDSDDSLVGAALEESAERFEIAPKRSVAAPWEGAAAGKRDLPHPLGPPASAPFKPPPARAPAGAAFDPLDRPLSPEEFESSISGRPMPLISPAGEDSAVLRPEDLISGSEQVMLPEVQRSVVIPSTDGSPLDEPLSPDDFSYSGPVAGRLPSAVLPSVAAPGPVDPLDEPLSPDDFSYDPERAAAVGARGDGDLDRPRSPPAKPIVGPAPPMAIPRDALRQVPVMKSALVQAIPADPLDEPLAPSDFSEAVIPKGVKGGARRADAGRAAAPARAEAGPKPAPVRIVAKKGQPPVKVATKPLPKQRPRTDSRLLRIAIPSAVVAILLVLGVTGFLHWRAGRLRAAKVELAEKAEAVGDYPSLRTALGQYREVSDEVTDSREHLARVARTYALLAFEFGLPDDRRESRTILDRLRAMGAADPASAPIEAAAWAYMLASEGRLDDAELTLRPYQTPDPHVAYIRARVALQREAYEEAERILREATRVPPSWVRQSCALVDAMLGQNLKKAEGLQLLEGLGATHGRHVGVRLLRARLLAGSPHMREQARLELQSLVQPALWNSAAPSEQAWVHLLNAFLALDGPGGRPDATRALRSAREVGVGDVKFRLMLVRVLLGLRQLVEAKAELADIVRTAPPRARSEAGLLLAETHLSLGEIAEAEALLTQVDESARRHLLKGRVLMAQRKMAEALGEFRIAKTQDPSLAMAFEVDLESARAQLNIGETSTAVETARALVRDHPDNVTVALLLGDALLKAGTAEATPASARYLHEAEQAYQNAIRLAPESVDARLKLANLARWRGDLSRAREMLEEILARDGGNIEAHIVRASLAGESGNLPDARQLLARIQQLPSAVSEPGAVAVLEAELSLRAGTLEGVEALLERAQRGGASDGEYQHVLGLWKLRTYKIADALQALRIASGALPGDSVRSAELARAYRLSDATKRDTEQMAEGALRIDQRLADAIVVRALILMDDGALGPAATLLRQAEQGLLARPRDANVQAFLTMAKGRYEYEQGRAQEAQRLLEEAIRLDARLAEAHYFLGLTFIDLARTRDACTELGRFLEIAPGVRDTADAESERRRLGCR
jgi:tetratricopeptide (TPR) repeat protein